MYLNYVRSHFIILDVPAHTLLAYTTSPKVSAQILFFKEDIAEIYFVNYYQSKNQKQRFKIKKLLYKDIGKFQIKTPRRALVAVL